MKNLLTYIYPEHIFTEDHVNLVKIQLENTLRYWTPEKTLLVTNFPYSYNGFEAIVVPDNLFCQHRKRASKINVICYLLKQEILNELCWFHDFDAFQIEQFPEDILGAKDAGFTDYGYSEQWNTGSFFFTPKAVDLFLLIQKVMYEQQSNEEQALQLITARNMATNCVRLDSSYNLWGGTRTKETYDKSEKPIKVLHFHPGWALQYDDVRALVPDFLKDLFLKYEYGKNHWSVN